MLSDSTCFQDISVELGMPPCEPNRASSCNLTQHYLLDRYFAAAYSFFRLEVWNCTNQSDSSPYANRGEFKIGLEGKRLIIAEIKL
jgi:hypothetical protein